MKIWWLLGFPQGMIGFEPDLWAKFLSTVLGGKRCSAIAPVCFVLIPTLAKLEQFSVASVTCFFNPFFIILCQMICSFYILEHQVRYWIT